MGQRYLMDTNAVIDYLDKKLPLNTIDLVQCAKCNLSVISRIELLANSNATKRQLQVVKKFISASTVYPLEEPVILKGSDIRKINRIKLPDAIIAATAIVNGLTLITHNMVDFKDIQGLKVINSRG